MRRVIVFSLLVVMITSPVLLMQLFLPRQNSPQETLHIALGANMHVIPGLVTTMWSVQQHTRAPGMSVILLPLCPHSYFLNSVLFYLFVTEDKEATAIWQMMECMGIPKESVASVVVIEERDYYVAQVRSDLSISTNFVRLFLPEELPSDISKVLWLDSDVVAQRDLTELWRSAFEGPYRDFAVAAVPRVDGKDYEYTFGGKINNSAIFKKAFAQRYPDGNIDLEKPAFNAGVMLLNLANLRKEQGRYAKEEMVWWAKWNLEKKCWTGGSQPLAMLLAEFSQARDYQRLDPVWNVEFGATRGNAQKGWNEKTGILHWTWTQPVKPWLRDLRQRSLEFWLPYGYPVMKCYRKLELPET